MSFKRQQEKKNPRDSSRQKGQIVLKTVEGRVQREERTVQEELSCHEEDVGHVAWPPEGHSGGQVEGGFPHAPDMTRRRHFTLAFERIVSSAIQAQVELVCP